MEICNRHGSHTCGCHAGAIRRFACSFWTFLRTWPTREKGEMHMPLDLSNFGEMHLFPD